MFDAIGAAPAASAMALTALACLAACPMMRSRPGLLGMQLGAGLAFTAHYALLGVWAAALVCALGALQALAALFAGRHAALGRIGWGLIPLMVATGAWFWTGWSTLFCVAAMATIALARMQAEERRLRRMLLAGGAIWLVHDVMVAAWIAAAADVLAIGLGLHALRAAGDPLLVRWRAEPLAA